MGTFRGISNFGEISRPLLLFERGLGCSNHSGSLGWIWDASLREIFRASAFTTERLEYLAQQRPHIVREPFRLREHEVPCSGACEQRDCAAGFRDNFCGEQAEIAWCCIFDHSCNHPP